MDEWSDEARLAFAPESTYRRLAVEPGEVTPFRALRRPAIVLLVISTKGWHEVRRPV